MPIGHFYLNPRFVKKDDIKPLPTQKYDYFTHYEKIEDDYSDFDFIYDMIDNIDVASLIASVLFRVPLQQTRSPRLFQYFTWNDGRKAQELLQELQKLKLKFPTQKTNNEITIDLQNRYVANIPALQRIKYIYYLSNSSKNIIFVNCTFTVVEKILIELLQISNSKILIN